MMPEATATPTSKPKRREQPQQQDRKRRPIATPRLPDVPTQLDGQDRRGEFGQDSEVLFPQSHTLGVNTARRDEGQVPSKPPSPVPLSSPSALSPKMRDSTVEQTAPSDLNQQATFSATLATHRAAAALAAKEQQSNATNLATLRSHHQSDPQVDAGAQPQWNDAVVTGQSEHLAVSDSSIWRAPGSLQETVQVEPTHGDPVVTGVNTAERAEVAELTVAQIAAQATWAASNNDVTAVPAIDPPDDQQPDQSVDSQPLLAAPPRDHSSAVGVQGAGTEGFATSGSGNARATIATTASAAALPSHEGNALQSTARAINATGGSVVYKDDLERTLEVESAAERVIPSTSGSSMGALPYSGSMRERILERRADEVGASQLVANFPLVSTSSRDVAPASAAPAASAASAQLHADQAPTSKSRAETSYLPRRNARQRRAARLANGELQAMEAKDADSRGLVVGDLAAQPSLSAPSLHAKASSRLDIVETNRGAERQPGADMFQRRVSARDGAAGRPSPSGDDPEKSRHFLKGSLPFTHSSQSGSSSARHSCPAGEPVAFEDALSYVDATPVEPIGGAGGLTLSVWVRRGKQTPSSDHLIDFGNGPNADNIVISFEGGTTFEVHQGDKRQVLSRNSAESFPIDRWTHLAVVHHVSGTASIFWDGVEQARGQVHLAERVARCCYFLGRSHWKRDPAFIGSVRDLLVFNRALGLAELDALQQGNALEGLGAAVSFARAPCPPSHGRCSTENVARFDGSNASFHLIVPALPLGHSTFLSSHGSTNTIRGAGMTIIAWVKRDANSDAAERLVDFGSGPHTDNIILSFSNGMTYEVYRSNHSERLSVSPASGVSVSFPKRFWTHVALVHHAEDDEAILFWNGVPKASASVWQPRRVPRRAYLVGRSHWRHLPTFRGHLHDLMVFDKPLNASEIEDVRQGISIPTGKEPIATLARTWCP